MLTAYLVRHGQTTNSKKGIITGHGDSPLTPNGTEAIIHLSSRLKGTRFEAIYSSDLQRALSTAQVIVKTLDLMLEVIPSKELREINYGIYTNKRKSDVAKECPEYKGAVDFIFPGGESFAQLQLRAAGFMRQIERRHDNNTILLVTHAGTIRAISCDAHKGNLRHYLQAEVSHNYLARIITERGELVSYAILAQ